MFTSKQGHKVTQKNALHLWANTPAGEFENQWMKTGSSTSVKGDEFISYATPIAVKVQSRLRVDKTYFLISTASYSSSTSKHQRELRQALPGEDANREYLYSSYQAPWGGSSYGRDRIPSVQDNHPDEVVRVFLTCRWHYLQECKDLWSAHGKAFSKLYSQRAFPAAMQGAMTLAELEHLTDIANKKALHFQAEAYATAKTAPNLRAYVLSEEEYRGTLAEVVKKSADEYPLLDTYELYKEYILPSAAVQKSPNADALIAMKPRAYHKYTLGKEGGTNDALAALDKAITDHGIMSRAKIEARRDGVRAWHNPSALIDPNDPLSLTYDQDRKLTKLRKLVNGWTKWLQGTSDATDSWNDSVPYGYALCRLSPDGHRVQTDQGVELGVHQATRLYRDVILPIYTPLRKSVDAGPGSAFRQAVLDKDDGITNSKSRLFQTSLPVYYAPASNYTSEVVMYMKTEWMKRQDQAEKNPPRYQEMLDKVSTKNPSWLSPLLYAEHGIPEGDNPESVPLVYHLSNDPVMEAKVRDDIKLPFALRGFTLLPNAAYDSVTIGCHRILLSNLEALDDEIQEKSQAKKGNPYGK